MIDVACWIGAAFLNALKKNENHVNPTWELILRHDFLHYSGIVPIYIRSDFYSGDYSYATNCWELVMGYQIKDVVQKDFDANWMVEIEFDDDAKIYLLTRFLT